MKKLERSLSTTQPFYLRSKRSASTTQRSYFRTERSTSSHPTFLFEIKTIRF
ncbi:hypothetical protein ACJ2PR_03780 [Phormidesmis sp. 146-33]